MKQMRILIKFTRQLMRLLLGQRIVEVNWVTQRYACLQRAQTYSSRWVYLRKRLAQWRQIFCLLMKPQSKCLVNKFWKLISIAIFGILIFVIYNQLNYFESEHSRLLKHFESIKMAQQIRSVLYFLKHASYELKGNEPIVITRNRKKLGKIQARYDTDYHQK